MKKLQTIKRTIILLMVLIIAAPGGYAQEFDSLAQTPPMGWNSWNKFGWNVNEELIREMADAMVESGMKDAGYEYVVIDDCWQIERDEEGNIVADPERFPSGMKALADYIHSKGLKFGIYSCAGSKTCQGRPGSRGHEFQDARQYAEWGVDYLKYDWCYNEGQKAEAAYTTMSDALKASGRPIVFSICEWGDNEPWQWAKDIGHLWRTTHDIRDCFDCKINWGGVGVLQILDQQVGLARYAGPGHWNDPDMLEIGNGGMTETEYKSHFSLWAMLAAPLMAGNDLRNMDASTTEILTNKDVIAVNQDPLGRQGIKYLDMGEHEVWVKLLENEELAVCFLNREDEPWEMDYDWQRITLYHGGRAVGFDDPYFTMKDLWKHQVIGTTKDRLTETIPGHGVLMLRLTPEKK